MPKKPCTAREQAAARSGIDAASFDEEQPISAGDFDFDRDGTDDVVLRFGSSNAQHQLFLRAEPCPRFLGAIPAARVFGLSCTREEQGDMCVISAAILMIHGEAQHQSYAFDGTQYVAQGPSRLGPRPPGKLP